ncbi:LytTR family transcriptional regulator DNA-binding domain-containing protein [Filimonas effusa]|uniref:HTH LytTR-type domain-containing protein n=1 Tax=Filimonas effusa TaxID=2508721 RepID=A0A4Q1D9V8_9BACT|nr:LytTR family transcriptional regulator DNA-binding domain-containing protein [Filimonas effusa]RXK85668.1 hypothetical protein ESB13_02310 [Filimonas effusa]
MENDTVQKEYLLKGENKKELLDVEPEKVICLHAADNYARIFYIDEEDRICSVLFRSSLKKQEELLSRYPFFFRCHKRYLVNVIHVHEVAGNGVNLKLRLQCMKGLIPVSRTLHQQTLALLEQYTDCLGFAEG